MTDTLARYAAAFAKVKEKWPDAPGLPEGYQILDKEIYGPCMILGKREDHMAVPSVAALALCTVTAMEIGAWWVDQNTDDYRMPRVFYINETTIDYEGVETHHQGWLWSLRATERAERAPTQALAYLAALEAITKEKP